MEELPTVDNHTGAQGATPPEPGGELFAATLSIDDSAPQGISDVHSGAPDNSLEGMPYGSWREEPIATQCG